MPDIGSPSYNCQGVDWHPHSPTWKHTTHSEELWNIHGPNTKLGDTQVPIDETLKVIEEKLASDETLGIQTNILAPQLIELTELCIKDNLLQVSGHLL